ncbi:MAG: aspartate-semialdehyde dehydrogenase [Bacteroidetes bacterium]|nr:aspartate-semialdehyde dehydrogenase [Bacteroidota bacterium]
MKVAVVGVTGLVGTKMLQVLEERHFPVTELLPVASESSLGKEIVFGGKRWTVMSMHAAVEAKPDIALFSAGGSVSKEFAPQFAAVGTYVIDNSSAWRMETGVPLVVPEVNADTITRDNHIIANPNCSTIQMVVALKPLHDAFAIRRIVVSTYQSITGTGQKAVAQMEAERKGETATMVYPHRIDLNILPHIDSFLENGYTKEEMKMVNETRKIMGTPSIGVSATTVRVPTTGGHSESINVEFHRDFDLNEVRNLLKHAPGVILQDDPAQNVYPMPMWSHDKDDVFVGRLRRDESQPNTLNMWVVSDNLRKGAATNAVQIAEALLAKGFVRP